MAKGQANERKLHIPQPDAAPLRRERDGIPQGRTRGVRSDGHALVRRRLDKEERNLRPGRRRAEGGGQDHRRGRRRDAQSDARKADGRRGEGQGQQRRPHPRRRRRIDYRLREGGERLSVVR